ncbi:putative F0F1-ATPase subunit (Ca2+/Mg2+ transporter) [Orenia metallireducens]|jgi:F0F1-type ATP synthase assembly protein I|uniref:Putative F0F1-ATPase subunit Ca2+/Mg2+ transporter n=1 Tax=Orenia metallireducens TaxID=1413210 RepID=A0A285GLC6_9FIRM|nr:AtpZ/AtpI family protein [Orenia metallireducens]PRX35766.1 putative F0F1-ATPase subunit (Ca2+/Mg2+ transporter) [Orenia metallireducens]SNY24123.1 Putative F0F1-ATPase subunit Ca2+/Mg2+ transporter [Orenia metallireducens]
MKENIGILKALALLSQVGISIIIPIIICVWFGNKLDQWLGTNAIFLIIFTILGVITGFRSAYRLLMSTEKDRKG